MAHVYDFKVRQVPDFSTLQRSSLAGGGQLPILLADNEPGSEIEHPMSVVILGGVITSTALNLLGIPALYWAFERKAGIELIP
ncbi:efflux RND transporter permease subunit [Hymenobacter swuensis]|uniref:Acriflavin resistance protein n=1 Tax=Hymenobacter swuensis DY53 TaxID=1227739 RepID=W8FBC6_9BACT|nr:efflux RND transporter permease subunit [Hymenobacter swuensis]AHJ98975.1 acriflavin resistance protein [Hymenobacter swuensis DY53]